MVGDIAVDSPALQMRPRDLEIGCIVIDNHDSQMLKVGRCDFGNRVAGRVLNKHCEPERRPSARLAYNSDFAAEQFHQLPA